MQQVQVAYGYSGTKLSRKKTEEFIQLHASTVGVQVPTSPIVRFWCRESPADSPAKFILGWTGFVPVKFKAPPPPTPRPLVTLD